MMEAKTVSVKPGEIRMIALDLDGTTLARGHITPRTRSVLETAITQGVHVVIATGRVFSALPKDVFRIKGLEYVVTSNGAIITKLETGDVIYKNCIGRDAISDISQLLRQHPEFPVEIFTEGKAYIDKKVYEELADHGPAASYMSRTYVMRTRTPVEGILHFMEENGGQIENINIHFKSLEDKAQMRALLEQIPNITLTSSMTHNIEIGGASTSKANALAVLCDMAGICLQDVMACGDSHNDMAMLAESGLGIGMKNGAQEVQDMADYIAPSNEDEGVAFVVEKFVLEMERSSLQMGFLTAKNRILSKSRRAARKVFRNLQGKR